MFMCYSLIRIGLNFLKKKKQNKTNKNEGGDLKALAFQLFPNH